MENIIRVLICGSRNFNNYALLELTCNRILARWLPVVEIVEGGSYGADKLAARFAEAHTLMHTTFTADWGTFGKRAGFIRNNAMGEYCEFGICIGFWDGHSPGTKMMLDLAENKFNMQTFKKLI